MKIKFLIVVFLFFFLQHQSLDAQERIVQKIYKRAAFAKMNNQLSKGWNTWDTRSVMCHVLLPESLSINLQLVNHQSGDTLKEALIGREDFGSKEHVIPGPHAYDGSYTEMVVDWQNIKVKVQSVTKNGQLFLLISPIQYSPKDSIIVSPKMIWGRQGKITVNNGKISAITPTATINLGIVGGQYTSMANCLKVSMRQVTVLCSDLSKSTQDVEKMMSEARAKFVAGSSKYKGAS